MENKENIIQSYKKHKDEFTEKQRELFELRFGLRGEDPKTLAELAPILGVTRERIRQVETKIIRRLKEIEGLK